MKKIIIKSCLDCPYFYDFDDPPGYCKHFDVDIDIPDEYRSFRVGKNNDYIWEGCKLEDYPDYNTAFHNWLEKNFPHIKKEWDAYQEMNES